MEKQIRERENLIGKSRFHQANRRIIAEVVKKIKLDYVAVSIVAPYPGTKLYQYCVEHDMLRDICQEGRDLLQLRYKAINLEHLSLDDPIYYHKKFYSAFMLRPSYALHMLRLHPQEVLFFWPTVFEMVASW